MKITVEDGNQISEEAVNELGKHADMIECQCPNKLIEILARISHQEIFSTARRR